MYYSSYYKIIANIVVLLQLLLCYCNYCCVIAIIVVLLQLLFCYCNCCCVIAIIVVLLQLLLCNYCYVIAIIVVLLQPRIWWCGTGGFQEQGQCFFIGLSCSIPTIVFYSFSLSLLSFYRLVLWGWVFGLIGCISLSLSLALLTVFLIIIIIMKTCSSLVKIVSDGENKCICKINAISGWGIETFYLVTKNTNLGSSIHLLGVDFIEIENSILIIETYFYMIYKCINIGIFAV